MSRALTVVAAVLGVLSAPATANPIEQFEEAASYSQKGQWQEAADAFAEIAAGNPYHGVVWQRYGFALHQLGQYPDAIAAFERSIDLGFQPVASMYNIACGHALLGHRDEALKWLARAMDNGFDEQDLLGTDTDLDSLRDDRRFRKLVEVPAGLSRDEQWRYDLGFLARRMEQVHYDLYGVVSRETFEQAIEDLQARVPSLADYEIAVGIQRILAMVGDGHTSLRPPTGARFGIQQLPIQVYAFSDGLFVRSAAPEYAPAVGCRIVKFGDTSADDAFDAVAQISSVDNTRGLLASVPRYLVISQILHALGVIESVASVPLTVENRAGEQFTVYLEPEPYGEGPEHVLARDDATAPLPLWLKGQNDAFWFEFLEDEKLVYFKYNAVRDKSDETMADFCQRLFEFIEDNPVDSLVIDMRNNGGGNNFLNQPLVHGLIKCEKINRPGHLFVIAGRHTFSAAMNGAADIENHTEALFVGEPTGSKPNFVGETTMITLPCSELRLSCSSLYWQRSHAFDHRTWIAPDLLAEMSSEDYRTNRDPAMEAILALLSAP